MALRSSSDLNLSISFQTFGTSFHLVMQHKSTFFPFWILVKVFVDCSDMLFERVKIAEFTLSWKVVAVWLDAYRSTSIVFMVAFAMPVIYVLW